MHWRLRAERCTLATLQDPSAAFQAFAKTHRKVYHSRKESQARKAAFISNLHYMVQENSKRSNPCALSLCCAPCCFLVALHEIPPIRPRVTVPVSGHPLQLPGAPNGLHD